MRFMSTVSNPHIIPDSDPSSEDDLPNEIKERAEKARSDLMPKKSKPKYESTYNTFMQWMANKKIGNICEDVILAYFHELSEKFKASTLWATYSMLRSVIHLKHNINIHDFAPLIQFLKNNSKGYVAVKAKVLDANQIIKFIREAPDDKYLAVKICMIFGVQGACRKQELCDVTISDITDKGDMVIVKIPVTKTDKPRSFIITDEFYNIYKKYAALRPEDVKTNRFFLRYSNGQCVKQAIGINTFGKMPSTVAAYLGLENPSKYTGHTFRRTSATLLADAGADILTLKRHGGWKSNTVAEGYVEDSLHSKAKISRKISSSITREAVQDGEYSESTATVPGTSSTSDDTGSSSSKVSDSFLLVKNSEEKKLDPKESKTTHLSFSHCNNVTIILKNNETN